VAGGDVGGRRGGVEGRGTGVEGRAPASRWWTGSMAWAHTGAVKMTGQRPMVDSGARTDVEGGRCGGALSPGGGGADRAETAWGGARRSSEVRGGGARVAMLGWRRIRARARKSISALCDAGVRRE
jgi:hypothetical protein